MKSKLLLVGGGLFVLLSSLPAFAKFQGKMNLVQANICSINACIQINAKKVSSSAIQNLLYYETATIKLYNKDASKIIKEWKDVDIISNLDSLSFKLRSSHLEILLELNPLSIQEFAIQTTAAK